MLYPHGWISRWRLKLSHFDFTDTYRPGTNNQVPYALSKCTPEYRDDVEVEDEIPICEAHAFVFTRAQATSRKNNEEEGTPEEEVSLYDVWG